jgi:hypothetical protein
MIADLADLEEVFDIELVDRVEGHARGSSSIVPAGKRFNLGSTLPDELHGARYNVRPSDPPEGERIPGRDHRRVASADVMRFRAEDRMAAQSRLPKSEGMLASLGWRATASS